MHTNWCVLIEISMEIGMLNFWLGLLVTAQTKENYFSGTQNLSRKLSKLILTCLKLWQNDVRITFAKDFIPFEKITSLQWKKLLSYFFVYRILWQIRFFNPLFWRPENRFWKNFRGTVFTEFCGHVYAFADQVR